MSIASEITRLQTAKAGLKTAIEGKGVTVSSSALLDDYPDLVDAIQTGGGGTDYLLQRITNTLASYTADLDNKTIQGRALSNVTALTALHLSGVKNVSNYSIDGCDHLETAVIKFYAQNSDAALGVQAMAGCTRMTTLDVSNCKAINSQAFNNSAALATIILRGSLVTSLNAVAAFNGTPFKSGGTGGTIYIPKSLYDHLGDGTSSDYKAASNWSTINGYGTITWAKIEGSYYETHYADGTVIS